MRGKEAGITNRVESSQEKALRCYFEGGKTQYGVAAIVSGVIICAVSMLVLNVGDHDISAVTAVGIISGIGLVILGGRSVRHALSSVPLDQEVDHWLEEAMQRITQESYGRLNIDSQEPVTDPLVIRGPILWSTMGIPDYELKWRMGKDGNPRFSAYRVVVILLTDSLFGAYSGDYNFLRDVFLNEENEEYHYRHVVGVALREAASSYTLPSQVSLVHAQHFSVSLTSGDHIDVVINCELLRQMTGSERMPDSGAEKAVSAIRAMLRGTTL